MHEFEPSTYEIVQEGSVVLQGPFSSCPEILGFIARRLPHGVYAVYRIHPIGARNRPWKSFWAEVTNHGEECVTYRPHPTRS